MSHQVLLYYNYTDISDPALEKERQINFCTEFGLTGRAIIASEGINATLEGSVQAIKAYKQWLVKDSRFVGTHFKVSQGDGKSFPKLSVKVRPEIVSLNLLEDTINPNKTTGKYLKAQELHDWIHSGKEFYIIDMRNDYEFQVGHFAHSILPSLSNFRDLPKILPEITHLKNKTIVTVCTGGIRCEKASGYLLTQGFLNVYQLYGGIHTYMEEFPNEDFLGKLYVFDKRITMGFNTDDVAHTVVGRCFYCNLPADDIIDCSNVYCKSKHNTRHFVCCKLCQKEKHGKCKNCSTKPST